MKLRIVLTVISYMLFAAHLSRHNLDLPAIVALIMPFLFFVRKRIILYLHQTILYIASVSWIVPSIDIVNQRMANGQPYLRFVIIISVVVIFTLVSAIMLNSPKIKDKYT